MPERLDDVWLSRDYPVLLEITRRIDAGHRSLLPQTVARALAIDDAEITLALKALLRRNLVSGIEAAEFGLPRINNVIGEAYFLTGLHPNGHDATEALIDALRQAADQVDDEGEKTRIQRAIDGIRGVSKGVIGGVLNGLALQSDPALGASLLTTGALFRDQIAVPVIAFHLATPECLNLRVAPRRLVLRRVVSVC